MSPGAAIVLYRRRVKRARELREMRDMRVVMEDAAGTELLNAREGVERRCCALVLENRVVKEGDRDIERGSIGKAIPAERGEACGVCEGDGCHS